MDAIAEAGINTMDAIQYFHAADRIRDTVVGIAASLALNREGAAKDLPIIAFAAADDGIKVSARTTRDLVARGLDLERRDRSEEHTSELQLRLELVCR